MTLLSTRIGLIFRQANVLKINLLKNTKIIINILYFKTYKFIYCVNKYTDFFL